MAHLVQKLIPYLKSLEVSYRCNGSHIEVDLPGGFGQLEIKACDGYEALISLAGEEWQTDGDCLNYCHFTMEEKIFSYIQDIYRGKLLLIEEQQPGKPAEKKIESNLEIYMQQLPNRTKFKIFNQHLNQVEESSIFSDS